MSLLIHLASASLHVFMLVLHVFMRALHCCRDNKTGLMKGDALITFLQGPSVKLAMTVMDGRQLRPGEGPPMVVQEAQFEQKGSFVAKKRGKKTSKKKVLEQQERLLNWDGFDDQRKASEVRFCVPVCTGTW